MPTEETELGGPGGPFPPTSWTLIRHIKDRGAKDARERLGELLGIYWKPVYQYVRARWKQSNEEAKDLTQGFFALLLEGDQLERADASQGSFRGYLKSMLQHFLVDDARRKNAQKRGGESPVKIDLSGIEEVVADPAALTPDAVFDREWVGACVRDALKRLERQLTEEGKYLSAKILRAYYFDSSGRPTFDNPPTYAKVAAALGLKTYNVSNHVVTLRKRLREVLNDRVRDLTSDEPGAKEELRLILGE